MCLATEFTGNQTLVCQVGDLKPGDRYRTPDSKTMLVLQDDSPQDGGVRVVDLATGQVDVDGSSVKLGTDRAGRLYASRTLNGWHPVPSAAQADKVLPDITTV